MNSVETSPKIRMKEIAKQSNCSVSTVSKALSDYPEIHPDTKALITRISKKLNYRQHRKKKDFPISKVHNCNTIKRFGLMLFGSRIDDEAYSGILHGLSKSAFTSDVRIEFANVEDCNDIDLATERTIAYSRGLDGLLLIGIMDMMILEKIQQSNIPHVVIGELMTDVHTKATISAQLHVVMVNSMLAGQLATASLLHTGHQRIGFICEYLLSGLFYDKWLLGYRVALHEAGMVPSPELVHIAGKPFTGGGPAAKAMLVLEKPPSAFVVPDARTAASFIKEMQIGGCHIDKSNIVVFTDDYRLKKYGLEGCRTICFNANQLTDTAVEQLIKLCDQPGMPGVEIIVPLVMRNLP